MEQQIDKIFCPQCGAECDENTKFCMRCGTNLQENNSKRVTNNTINQVSPEKSKESKPAKKKSKAVVIIIVICIVVALLLCAGLIALVVIVKKIFSNNETTNNEVTTMAKEELVDKIIADNFTSDSKITSEMKEEVEIVVENVKSDSVVITVEAPDISEELFEWLNAQETYTDEEFENKIIDLMENGKKEVSTYELHYSENSSQIEYTQECKNSMNCGLTDFYNMCMQQVIEEMKAGEQ